MEKSEGERIKRIKGIVGLDELDLKVIEYLKNNARIPAAQIAEEVGVTRMTIHNRIKRLEELGVIKQYTVKLGIMPPTPTLPSEIGELKRITTGIPGLDEIIEGGIPRGTSTLVIGPPGAGKTIFGLQYLFNGAKKGEPGLLISFQESLLDIITIGAGFGWNFRDLMDENLISVISTFSPEVEVHRGADYEKLGQWSLTEQMEENINRMEPSRVVIDSISVFLTRFEDIYQKRRELFRLNNYLRSQGCTTLLVSEIGSLESELHVENYVIQNVFLLSYFHKGTERVRQLEVLKMFGTNHSKHAHIQSITKNGLEVHPRAAV